MGAKADKYKFGARVGKYKLGARAGKYRFGARAGKHKLGARAGVQGQDRRPSKAPGAGKYKHPIFFDKYFPPKIMQTMR